MVYSRKAWTRGDGPSPHNPGCPTECGDEAVPAPVSERIRVLASAHRSRPGAPASSTARLAKASEEAFPFHFRVFGAFRGSIPVPVLPRPDSSPPASNLDCCIAERIWQGHVRRISFRAFCGLFAYHFGAMTGLSRVTGLAWPGLACLSSPLRPGEYDCEITNCGWWRLAGDPEPKG